ncbi:NUDIX hydrolase N-terminal domain-containing protein [Halocatena marina]|uniref:NUDIX hydrolase N-terminal domain-containing protein n=1 Tax=Halocatena marina TaxID=2934937 RepID=UPI0024144D21|nr:NUDIX hydrolase N-terminal domain-containing protein [Halocatena marina]
MDILPLLDELRLLARDGLRFSDDPYDRERYTRLMELVETYYAKTLELPEDAVQERLQRNLGCSLSAGAATFDGDEQILLMKRTDNDKWGLPGGLVEPHESPPEAAVRETREETGYEINLLEMTTVNFRKPGEDGLPHRHVHFVYRSEIIGGMAHLSAEGQELKHWRLDRVPSWNGEDKEYALQAQRHQVAERTDAQ